MLKYAGQHRHTSHTTIKQSQSMPYGPMKMFASPVLCALAACTTNFGIVYELISYGVAVLWWMCIIVVVVEPLVFLLFYLYFARHRTTKEPNGSDQQLYLAQICLFALLLLLLLMWFCWLAVADRLFRALLRTVLLWQPAPRAHTDTHPQTQRSGALIVQSWIYSYRPQLTCIPRDTQSGRLCCVFVVYGRPHALASMNNT